MAILDCKAGDRLRTQPITLIRRPEADLSRLSIGLDLRAINVVEGVLAALSITVLIALNQWLQWPTIMEAALAALPAQLWSNQSARQTASWGIFGRHFWGVFSRRSQPQITWHMVIYAALSLTVIRVLRVFLALTRAGMTTTTKLFIGWFGPRGLASIVFAVIVFDAGLPGRGTVAATAACTVLLSVIAHGMTANPLVTVLGPRR